MQWEPAADVDQGLTYTVSAEGANVETKRATTAPGGLSVTLSSLRELTEYTVSVQAVNSGGLSRPLTAAVRMVTVGQLGLTEFYCYAVFSVCSETTCVSTNCLPGYIPIGPYTVSHYSICIVYISTKYDIVLILLFPLI